MPSRLHPCTWPYSWFEPGRNGARMAKRNSKVARKGGTPARSVPNARAAAGMKQRVPAAAIEQRVLAFAKQAGYVAGTIQMKAEGWMDREALRKQLASVRDGASSLLEQLGNAAAKSQEAEGRAAATKGRTSAQRRRGRCAGQEASQAGAVRSGRRAGAQSGTQDALGHADGEDGPVSRTRLAAPPTVRRSDSGSRSDPCAPSAPRRPVHPVRARRPCRSQCPRRR